MKNILIMCGDKLRHKYFAIRLLKQFPNIKVIIEKHYEDTSKNYLIDSSEIIKKHFKDFDEQEEFFFEPYVKVNSHLIESNTIKTTEPKGINDKDVVSAIKEYNPDIIIVFSTSLIGEEIIDLFPNKKIFIQVYPLIIEVLDAICFLSITMN